MTGRNIFIISLSAIFLFVFCWLLMSLTKSVSRFTDRFSQLSDEQVVQDTEETDVTQQDTTFSSGANLFGSSEFTADGEMDTSSYSAQDDVETDKLVEIIARLAAEAGMDPVDFLDMLLAEWDTDSQITVQHASATGGSNSETVSEPSTSNLQMTSGESFEDFQSISSTSTTAPDNISQEELEQLLRSLSTPNEEYPRTIPESNYQEEIAEPEPADSELETENYDDQVDDNNGE